MESQRHSYVRPSYQDFDTFCNCQLVQVSPKWQWCVNSPVTDFRTLLGLTSRGPVLRSFSRLCTEKWLT
jgi:hypothetical protein